MSGAERARFEAHWKSTRTAEQPFQMVYPEVRQAWSDWQAATAAEREACAELRKAATVVCDAHKRGTSDLIAEIEWLRGAAIRARTPSPAEEE